MVLPLSTVTDFGSYGGNFVLLVQCLKCKHERAIPAEILGRRFGHKTRVTAVVQRLRCSKCGARRVDVLIGGIPR